jgi:hypothetical protein
LANQSHLSAKNMARLQTLAASCNPRIAVIVLEVAQIKPGKKGRLKVLGRERKDLLDALDRTGLIAAHHW